MAYSLTWLADVLRAAGLKVIEQPGWRDRGRAEMGKPRGILCHHTAGAKTGNAPSLKLVQDGRPDLPGPLSQLVLGRDGTWYVVAAGRCNHAGAGLWQGVSDGNGSLIGVEAENCGTPADPWPAVQMRSYVVGCAAILRHLREDSVMCAGHKEYAQPRGRKIDPSFDMVEFRLHIDNAMRRENPGELAVAKVSTVDPRRSMLRKGDQGASVYELQVKLGITADGAFGPATERAVMAFQEKRGLSVDGLVGPATWAALA